MVVYGRQACYQKSAHTFGYDRRGRVKAVFGIYRAWSIKKEHPCYIYGHPQGCVQCSSSRLDFRRLPIAYRDFSQNAQNGQKVPQNGEKNTIFNLSQVYTPPWGREGGPNAFFLTSASPKRERKRTSKVYMGVYLAQLGDPPGGRGAPLSTP